MSKNFDILIIDDEQVILDSVVKICSSENLTVDPAPDAAAGLGKLSKNTYRLIVCDIMLPDMNGFECLQEFNDRQIKAPVVMTSGYSTLENAVKSLYTGAIDFLPKPFTMEELLSVVHRGLRYSDIRELSARGANGGNDSLPFVPCPAKYDRLNYSGWVNFEFDGSAKIGVTDLFLRTINAIANINFFKIDEEIIQAHACAHFETNDELVHQFIAPVSGRIIKINELLANNLNLIEKDPYFNGWLYTIVPSNLDYERKFLSSCSSDRF